MLKTLGADMYALGRANPSEEVSTGDGMYRLEHVMKHDFWAATSLYRPVASRDEDKGAERGRIVLKLYRQQKFVVLPMRWIGRWLRRREMNNLRRLEGIANVPHVLGRFETTGFFYRYIQGRSLDEGARLSQQFFDELVELIRQIHKRRMAYMDMNKRGNILCGTDGRPYLIDFQISMHVGKYALGIPALSGWFLRMLQREDLFHLYKHKVRLRLDLVRGEELELLRMSRLIRVHRIIAGPFHRARRAVLRCLHRRGLLRSGGSEDRSPENNPDRFLRH